MKKTFFKASTRFFAKAGLGLMVTAAVIMMAPSATHADMINRQLQLGMSGSDVSLVQTFLAKDATLYPQGLVTGYFGFLTKSAVSNFQSRNGIDPVGRIGPATLPVINSQMANGMNTNTGSAPVIYNVGVNTNRNNVTVNWTTNEVTKGVVYYSTSPLVTYERENSVDVSGYTAMTDSNFHSAQNVQISNLQANTTYYYLIYTTNQAGIVSVTWPSSFQTTN